MIVSPFSWLRASGVLIQSSHLFARGGIGYLKAAGVFIPGPVLFVSVTVFARWQIAREARTDRSAPQDPKDSSVRGKMRHGEIPASIYAVCARRFMAVAHDWLGTEAS